MGKKSRPEPIPDFADVRVRLKPFLGLRPGTYLSILYAVLIALIVFFFLFNPGIASSGTYYRVSTFPAGAAVHVDGKYVGSTPAEILIKRGQRRIEVIKPFYRTEVLSEKVGGRIFGTLFVPPRKSIRLDLTVQDAEGLVAHALADFAAAPYIPQILLDTVQPAARQQELIQKMYDFLNRAKYFVSSSDSLEGFLRAEDFLKSGGATASSRPSSPQPSNSSPSLLGDVQDYIQSNDLPENAIFWALVSIPQESARDLIASPRFQDAHSRLLQWLEQAARETGPASPAPAGSPVSVAGIRFRPIPAGTLVQGKDEDPGFWRDRIDLLLPHPVEIPSFYLSETEVTNRQYAEFLAENPEWRKSNTDELVRQGKVTPEYLAGWQGDGYPAGSDSLPVVSVSYPAAQAFCRWLSGKLGGAFGGYAARLPSESEWEWAARGGLRGQPYPTGRTPEGARFLEASGEGPAPVGLSAPNGYGLKDMAGNVWEWCQDWFSPVAYLFSSLDARRNSYRTAESIPIGAERVVRGGSWANEKEMVKVYVRGSQPPSWCTPYLGFRVAIARP